LPVAACPVLSSSHSVEAWHLSPTTRLLRATTSAITTRNVERSEHHRGTGERASIIRSSRLSSTGHAQAITAIIQEWYISILAGLNATFHAVRSLPTQEQSFRSHNTERKILLPDMLYRIKGFHDRTLRLHDGHSTSCFGPDSRQLHGRTSAACAIALPKPVQ